MNPHCLMVKGPTGLIEVAGDADGNLKVTGEIETTPPEDGATETTLAAINTKTPALGQALAAASVPVVLTAAQVTTLTPPATVAVSAVAGALPAGSAHLGSVMPANSSGTALLPSAAALSNTMANPTTTLIGACLMMREPNAGQFRRPECDTSGRQQVSAHPITPSSTSYSTTDEEQRGIDFGFSLYDLTVFSDTAGYILLVNKSSDAANSDLCMGGYCFPIQANSTLTVGGEGTPPISFSSGLQAVFSSTPKTVTLGGAHCSFSIRGA